MSSEELKAAILVISTTAAQDPSTDKCISTLRTVFDAAEGKGGAKGVWTVAATKIVSDDVLEIQRALTAWTDGEEKVNLLVTSGGTGFAVKDVTPEAVNPLLHKHASGLVHAMLATSLSVTPFAMMARPTAGTRHNTVILTLPGSPKGAKENLEAVIKLLPHACMQAAGANSRNLHQGGIRKLEQDSGLSKGSDGVSQNQPHQHSHNHNHHHHHHHHSHSHGHGHGHAIPTAHTESSERPETNDSSLGPSRRYRSSPWPKLSVSDALERIRSTVPPATATTVRLSTLSTSHVLAADVTAMENVPAFRASIVDGYAVRFAAGADSNAKGVFPLAFVSHAEASSGRQLEAGEIARITTGAQLPLGADAVVMVEDTTVKSYTEDGKEEAEIEILTDALKKGENVREVGSDVRKGDIIMHKANGISALGGEFGLLASVGTKSVSVYRKPVVGVMSTGDEIIPFDREEDLRLGEVRDTNRPTLIAAARAQGFEVVDLGIVSDEPTSLESGLRTALTRVDVLITTGGVSMGELDLLKPTIQRSLGGTIHFGRVAMKPGLPTTFATVPAQNIKDPSSGARGGGTASDGETNPPIQVQNQDKVIFSLPGNPASAVVTFLLFVLPALHHMSGISPAGLPRIKVRLAHDMRCDASREEYHRVTIAAGRSDGRTRGGDDENSLWATSTGVQRSSRIGSFRGANALVVMPAGGGMVAEGSYVTALLMGEVVGAVSW